MRFIASPQQGPLPVGYPGQVVTMETNQDSIPQGPYSPYSNWAITLLPSKADIYLASSLRVGETAILGEITITLHSLLCRSYRSCSFMDLPHLPLLDWSASVSKLDILELRTQSIRARNTLLNGFGISRRIHQLGTIWIC